jgi:predicted nucleic acid-binding protein
MKVLVDTSVWSLALRRPSNAPLTAEQQACIRALGDLVADGRAALIGPIRQELLSGIKTASQFEALRASLTAFDDMVLSTGTYDLAAQCFNTCRANGVQGSNTDFLICAAAIQHHLPVFTLDLDFVRYQSHLAIRLYAVSAQA